MTRKDLSLIFLLIAFFQVSPSLVYSQVNNLFVPKREMRGVWVATVANIDWPSKPGLPSIEQKQELLRLLDAHQRAGINAIFLQVRPSADAIYSNGKRIMVAFSNRKARLWPFTNI